MKNFISSICLSSFFLLAIHVSTASFAMNVDASATQIIRIVGSGKDAPPLELSRAKYALLLEKTKNSKFAVVDQELGTNNPIRCNVSNTMLYALVQLVNEKTRAHFASTLTYAQKRRLISEAKLLELDHVSKLLQGNSQAGSNHLILISDEFGKFVRDYLPLDDKTFANPNFKPFIDAAAVEKDADNSFICKDWTNHFVDTGLSRDALFVLMDLHRRTTSDAFVVEPRSSLVGLKKLVFELDKLNVLSVRGDKLFAENAAILAYLPVEYFYLHGFAYLHGFGVERNFRKAYESFYRAVRHKTKVATNKHLFPSNAPLPTTAQDYQRSNHARLEALWEIQKLYAAKRASITKENMDEAARTTLSNFKPSSREAQQIKMLMVSDFELDVATEDDWQIELGFELNNYQLGISRFAVLLLGGASETEMFPELVSAQELRMLMRVAANPKSQFVMAVQSRIKNIDDEKISFYHLSDNFFIVDVRLESFKLMQRLMNDENVDVAAYVKSVGGARVALADLAKLGILSLENDKFFIHLKNPTKKIPFIYENSHLEDLRGFAYSYGCGVKKDPRQAYQAYLKKIKTTGDAQSLSYIEEMYLRGNITREMFNVAITEFFRVAYRTPATIDFGNYASFFAQRAFNVFMQRLDKKGEANLSIADIKLFGFAYYFQNGDALAWLRGQSTKSTRAKKQRGHSYKNAPSFLDVWQTAEVFAMTEVREIFKREIKEFPVQQVLATAPIAINVDEYAIAEQSCKNLAGHFGLGVGFYFNPEPHASLSFVDDIEPLIAPHVPTITTTTTTTTTTTSLSMPPVDEYDDELTESEDKKTKRPLKRRNTVASFYTEEEKLEKKGKRSSKKIAKAEDLKTHLQRRNSERELVRKNSLSDLVDEKPKKKKSLFNKTLFTKKVKKTEREKNLSTLPNKFKRDENFRKLAKAINKKEWKTESEISLSVSHFYGVLLELAHRDAQRDISVFSTNVGKEETKSEEKITASVMVEGASVPDGLTLHITHSEWWKRVDNKTEFFDFIKLCDPKIAALFE